MRGIFRCAITAGIMIPAGLGQSLFDQASFRSMSVGGVRLYGVSVYAGYATSAYPGAYTQAAPLYTGLGPDVNYGASTSAGWQHHGQHTDLGLTYSLNFGGLVQNSESNAFNHSLSFSMSHVLTPKWTLTLSANGNYSTILQYLYQPSNVALISQVPATMDDLAAAFSLGQFSSNQVASMLTGAPVLDSPARTLLVGSRILTYSGQASLTYAHSSRLNFHVSGVTGAGQNRVGGNDQVPEHNYAMPHSIGLNAGVGFSYMFSPRTQLGADLEESRTMNRYQGAFTTNASVSIGRKMSQRWFVTGHVGASITHMTLQLYGTPQTKQVAFGGSLGYRTYQHSFVATYERSGADPFGFAIGTNSTIMGGWSWHRPGARWSVFANIDQQRVSNTGYVALTGWVASGGIGEALSSNVQVSLQYVYSSNSGTYLGSATNLSAQSIRLTASWTPAPVIR